MLSRSTTVSRRCAVAIKQSLFSTSTRNMASTSISEFLPATTRLGFIGLGVMGNSMAKHCLNAGYKLNVYTRTTSKAQPLVDLGASLYATPREVAQQSDVVITMVGFPSDVREVILGEQGVLAGLRQGGVVVDMTTSQPALAREIAEEATKRQIYSVDAPVSGGDIGAREARLTIMIGGNALAVDALRPLFAVMGKNISYMGEAGSGQHTKMCNQILIASGMIGVVEGLLYAHKAGLDVEKTIATVSTGAAASWSLSNYGPRILKRNLDPGFFVEHFIKDMEIALDESRRMGLVLPGLTTAKMLYDMLKAHGYGKLGTHALILALEKINNTELIITPSSSSSTTQ